MAFLGIGKAKKKKYTRRPAKSLADILETAVKAHIAKDPDSALQLYAAEHGHAGLFSKADPVVSRAKELQTRMDSMALDAIEKDPQAMERFMEMAMQRLLGIKPERPRKGDDEEFDFEGADGGGNAFRLALEQLKDMEVFKKEMKLGKNGGLLSEEVLVAGMSLLKTMIGGRGAAAVEVPQLAQTGNYPQLREAERRVLVNIDGIMRELPESEYRQMLVSGKVQPIMLQTVKAGETVIATPPILPPPVSVAPQPVPVEGKSVAQVTPAETTKPSVATALPAVIAGTGEKPMDDLPQVDSPDEIFLPKITKEQVIGFISSLNIKDEFVPYLKGTPDRVVEDLKDAIQDYPFLSQLYEYLGKTDYDTLRTLVFSYQTEPELAPAWSEIALFFSERNRAWMEKLLALCQVPLVEPNESAEANSDIKLGEEEGKLV
jgi:hypothetical protein